MAITSTTVNNIGGLNVITVVSDLSGIVFYHWYVDGLYISTTNTNSWSYYLQSGGQARITITDTNDPDFDPIANAPDGWPSRRSIYWVRSTDTDVEKYKIEQKQDAGSFVEIGNIFQESDSWDFTFVTPRLVDLSDYTWRITPVDLAGNEGTAITIGPEKIVRTPDAPDFTITFDSGTTKVTFASAA